MAQTYDTIVAGNSVSTGDNRPTIGQPLIYNNLRSERPKTGLVLVWDAEWWYARLILLTLLVKLR